MMITTVPNQPAQGYTSGTAGAVPSKLVRDTIYLPSPVAARLFGNASGDGRQAQLPQPPQPQ